MRPLNMVYSALDASGRPSEVFKRMVDALFFFIVGQYPVFEDRDTAYIDDKMLVGFLSKYGFRSQDEVGVILLCAEYPLNAGS